MRHLPIIEHSARILLGLSLIVTISGCKGDGASPSKGDGGATNIGEGGAPNSIQSCERDADCDDSLFCNGEESCVDGFCRRGASIDCDDGIDCTVDSCSESRDACENKGPDADNDGAIDANCLDKDGNALGQDCDDDDPFSYPGATEVCDAEHRDEDCDPTTIGFRDADRDGYVDAQCCNEQDDGELSCGEDCDDNKRSVNPESPEVCDSFDNDCDGEVDEDVSIDMYPDADFDGHGDDSVDPVKKCPGAVGFALVANDCDDQDPEVFLGQFEICDGKDNNCDPKRLADEIKQQAPWYADVDGDTYGDPESTPILSCYRPKGRVLSQNDCNDSDNKIKPSAVEACDGIDNDCNGLVDYAVPGQVNDFEDDDGDGFADDACGGDDCNDTDARTAGGAEEVCDRVDNDCDGLVDEQTVQNIWYLDEDGDGWGTFIGSALACCEPLENRASRLGDCNDSDPDVHPGATETCDGSDQDCDGQLDEGASVSCKRPNALTTCSAGTCALFSCTPGFSDNNNDPSDGCEAENNSGPVVISTGCSTDSECSNHDICDGYETCFNNDCYAGTPINCGGGAGGTVLQGDVVVKNGKQLKSLGGVGTILGDLTIDSSTLVSLIGLEQLRIIGGSLIITNNPSLQALSGSALSNLELVGGQILIENNSALVDVDLPSLVSAGEMYIAQNNALEIIDGFESLVQIESGLTISENPALTSIEAFESLGFVGGDYSVVWEKGTNACQGSHGILIEDNTALTQLEAFSALTIVEGDLCILGLNQREANEVTSVLNFPSLSRVSAAIYTDSTTAVSALEFPVLNEVTYVQVQPPAQPIDPTLSLGRVLMPELIEIEQFELYDVGCSFTELDLAKVENTGGVIVTHACAEANADPFSLRLGSLTTTRDLYISTSFDQPTTSTTDLVFPELVDVSSLYLGIFSESVEEIRFPALETASIFQLSASTTSLVRVEAPLLQTAYDLSVNITPGQSSQQPSQLESMNFPALVSVGYQLNVDAPIFVVSQQAGLQMPNLSVVGTDDQDGDEIPDNNGLLKICTGTPSELDPNEYENAACDTIDKLVQTHGYVGSPDSCGQCGRLVFD